VIVLVMMALTCAEPATLDIVLTHLEGRENSVQNFSFEGTATTKFRSELAAKGLTREWKGICIADAKGRFFESGTEVSNQPPPEQTRTRAYDGEVTRELAGVGKEVHRGAVRKHDFGRALGVDPRDFLTHVANKPISEFLREGDSPPTLLKDDPSVEPEVVCIETAPVTTKTNMVRYKNRFYFDPERNFAFLRHERYTQNPGEEWYLYYEIRCKDLAEAEDGLWVPSHVDIMSYTRQADNPRALFYGIEADLTNWKLNDRLADETFVVPFPPGCFVDDQVAGKTYTVPKESP
jgi:hypothetical protein